MSRLALKLISAAGGQAQYVASYTITSQSGLQGMGTITPDGTVYFGAGQAETDPQNDIVLFSITPGGQEQFITGYSLQSETTTSNYPRLLRYLDGNLKMVADATTYVHTLSNVSTSGVLSDLNTVVNRTNNVPDVISNSVDNIAYICGSYKRDTTYARIPYFLAVDTTDNTVVSIRDSGINYSGQFSAFYPARFRQISSTIALITIDLNYGQYDFHKRDMSTGDNAWGTAPWRFNGINSGNTVTDISSSGRIAIFAQDGSTGAYYLEVWDSDATVLNTVTWTDTSGYTVWDVAFDDDDNVYVTLADNGFDAKILKFDSDLALLYAINTNNNAASYLRIHTQEGGPYVMFIASDTFEVIKVDGRDFPIGSYGNFNFQSYTPTVSSASALSRTNAASSSGFPLITQTTGSTSVFYKSPTASMSITKI